MGEAHERRPSFYRQVGGRASWGTLQGFGVRCAAQRHAWHVLLEHGPCIQRGPLRRAVFQAAQRTAGTQCNGVLREAVLLAAEGAPLGFWPLPLAANARRRWRVL